MRPNYEKYFNTLQTTPRSIPKSLPVKTKVARMAGRLWDYALLRLLGCVPVQYLDKALEDKIGQPPSKSKQVRKEVRAYAEGRIDERQLHEA